MKNVKIISGAQGTGKTVTARKIAEGKRVFETCETLPNALKYMPIDTEVIIIEMYFASDILNAIRADALGVKRPCQKEHINLVVPDLIITTCISIEFIEKIQAVEVYKTTKIMF